MEAFLTHGCFCILRIFKGTTCSSVVWTHVAAVCNKPQVRILIHTDFHLLFRSIQDRKLRSVCDWLQAKLQICLIHSLEKNVMLHFHFTKQFIYPSNWQHTHILGIHLSILAIRAVPLKTNWNRYSEPIINVILFFFFGMFIDWPSIVKLHGLPFTYFKIKSYLKIISPSPTIYSNIYIL